MSDGQQLSPGDVAPDFSLLDSTRNKVALSDFRGQHVIIYFYPAAGTPGCTTQACDFRDKLNELNLAGYQVLGISPDTPERLAVFAEQKEVTFPLLADPEKTVLMAWAAFGERTVYGRVVQSVIRSTFVVDPEGTIALAKYKVRATGHVARLIKEIGIAA
ncbi:thioredoxin-dependent thiol peroxidase [Lentzea sp. NPDC051213]|uniref:thioredoxin-dependent thiol peroxidase n=1 Tax=Lentzea sp. NPDC051213 TaxID=3364126 RepID=UPI00378AA934